MAVRVFAGRVCEPTCENPCDSIGDKREMTLHQETSAPPGESRKVNVESLSE
jgi:hypothetical protein